MGSAEWLGVAVGPGGRNGLAEDLSMQERDARTPAVRTVAPDFELELALSRG